MHKIVDVIKRKFQQIPLWHGVLGLTIFVA
jgi:hypothetical protein